MRLPEPIRLLIRLAAGVATLAAAWFVFEMLARELKTGRIIYVDHFSHEWIVYREQDPGEFWFRIVLGYGVVVFLAVLGMAGIFFVFKRVGGRVQRPEEVAARLARRHRVEREEASRLGMTVSNVERGLPEFSRGNRSCELIRGLCARYSLPRSGESTRAGWSLLQRTKREGAQLPNYYLLQGEVSDSLRQALTKVAEEFSEDYFEFEGTLTEVAVYWEEWGGASRVQDIHRILQSLAGL